VAAAAGGGASGSAAEISRREQVAGALRAADGPLSVAELAQRLGVHANTVRFHLGELLAAGRVERGTREPAGPGRPGAVYALRPGMDRGGTRDFGLLARILLSRVAADGPDAAQDAREAGRAWGRHLAGPPTPFRRRPTPGEALEQLTGLLAGLGFAPEPVDQTVGGRASGQADVERGQADVEHGVRLRHCPFLELAEEYGTVVCPLHLGLMQGALEELDAPLAATALEPFAEPDACLVRLRPARRAGGDKTPTTRRRSASGEGTRRGKASR
jgi:predicted ArsR family transcriptional regulator